MADIVAIGEPLFEFNQLPGQSLYRQGFGGDTSNFAIAAARAGASVAYLTRLGDEAFGRQFLELWDREGVDRSAVTLDPDAPTGIYFVSHGPAGHEFTYRRAGSAASRMRFTDAFAERIAGAKWLHLSGITQAIGPEACDAAFAALAHARASGVRVSYDLNFRPRLWPAARAAAIAQATIAACDLFLPSIDEAAMLFGIEDPARLIAFAHGLGARMVAVKLGARGALVSDGGTVHEVPAFAVEPVDATGAGDCFGGVTVARLLAGDSLPEAARAGCAAAALSTTGYGAIDPLPGRERIREALGIPPGADW
ncbi:sugar kinase [Burkholderiaceae bacterium FT117]|uniref:sugar kinase n=1 Tax=Zeimonas sediminis TaxID=2944268 RepID=UPI0023430AFE|nr:sugar kinase [Zeimonas sediminis]MCM5570309.1 sugar kinase [Zeimonas sediminis]